MKGPGRRGLGGGGRGRRAVTRKRVSEVGRMAENQGLPTRGGNGGGVWMGQHQPCPGEAARWPRASDINALLFQVKKKSPNDNIDALSFLVSIKT